MTNLCIVSIRQTFEQADISRYLKDLGFFFLFKYKGLFLFILLSLRIFLFYTFYLKNFQMFTLVLMSMILSNTFAVPLTTTKSA